MLSLIQLMATGIAAGYGLWSGSVVWMLCAIWMMLVWIWAEVLQIGNGLGRPLQEFQGDSGSDPPTGEEETWQDPGRHLRRQEPPSRRR